jgi:hypothetical protein
MNRIFKIKKELVSNRSEASQLPMASFAQRLLHCKTFIYIGGSFKSYHTM